MEIDSWFHSIQFNYTAPKKMPEGPEVARMAAEVRQAYRGAVCTRVEIRSGKYTRHGAPQGFADFRKDLPLVLASVQVKGKFCWFSWETKQEEPLWDTWVQFGMTGYFASQEFAKAPIPHIRSSEQAQEAEPKHGHIWFYFEKHDPLIFVDSRNFGTLRFVADPDETQEYLKKKLGPDPLRETLTREWWDEELKDRRPTTELAVLLLDQSFVAGIGNYLRAEILWKARILPSRTLGSLSPKEQKALLEALRTVPKEKAEEEEKTGDVSFWVYQRKKEDAKGHPTKQMKVKGRTVWYAPQWQS